MPNLSEASCYFCTKVIPEEALNCPSCGKERKELDDLRLRRRVGWVIALVCFIPTLIGANIGAWFVAAVIGAVGVAVATSSQQRYTKISGKKMVGW